MIDNLWNGKDDARVLAQANVEVWAPVPETSGAYQVSNMGRYRSTHRSNILRGSQSTTGYIMYPTGVNARKTSVAQRLVLYAFDGPPPSEAHTDARHLDGNKTNNCLTNLAWGTRSENMRDVWEQKAQGKPSSTTSVSPVHNRTYSLVPEAVQRGIKLFESGSVTLDDLATLWGCSRDVAKPALLGETWPGLTRDLAAIQKHLGRTGEAHHKAKFTEEELVEALKLYVENHWSGVQFGEALGITQLSAHMTLSGKRWAHVPRPEGFQYPWPDAATMNAKKGADHPATSLTEDEILEVFDRVVAGEFSSVVEVGNELGLSKSAAFSLVRGRSWPHLPRSDEFKAAVEGMMGRKVLTPAQREVIVLRLVENDTPETRELIMSDFGIDKAKLTSYITKANKRRLG